MRWNSLLVDVAAALLVLASPAFAQSDDLEVTLQVLDDVDDIDGVLLSVEDEEPAEAESDDAVADASDGPTGAHEVADEADEDFEPELDEESDGRVEDRDVAEPPAEDADEPGDDAETD